MSTQVSSSQAWYRKWWGVTLIIVVLLVLVVVTDGLFMIPILIALLPPVNRPFRKRAYFKSETFQALKDDIQAVAREYNEVSSYVAEIRGQGAFELGSSSTGQHAHLADFENTSKHNYRRDRVEAEYAPHVYNTSLQVVRNASMDPIKYLMKYFSIRADKNTLADVQRVSGDIARLEDAVANIREREASIAARIKPPAFILKHYREEFFNQVGLHLPHISVPHPRYSFEYTSAGGNSGQQAKIELNTPTLEALSETLVGKIRWAKSAAGQRALMTARLRGQIKERDRHACVQCGVSLADEPNLLLEVDHIIPVSRGGLSTEDNLQTLCWRCNRTKGAKIEA